MSSRAGRALVVFSKSPERGKVKTRLRPVLSEEQCLDLHLAFLKDTLEKTGRVKADSYLYLSNNISLPFVSEIPRRIQNGNDLGERMEMAFREVLNDHRFAVIVGTDCPMLTPALITDAFGALNDADLVLGPSEDGGYYLIGAKSVLHEAFHGIPWGTHDVLSKTLEAVEPQGHKVALLRPGYDIDQPSDLQRLVKERDKLEDATHTVAWLNDYVAR